MIIIINYYQLLSPRTSAEMTKPHTIIPGGNCPEVIILPTLRGLMSTCKYSRMGKCAGQLFEGNSRRPIRTHASRPSAKSTENAPMISRMFYLIISGSRYFYMLDWSCNACSQWSCFSSLVSYLNLSKSSAVNV